MSSQNDQIVTINSSSFSDQHYFGEKSAKVKIIDSGFISTSFENLSENCLVQTELENRASFTMKIDSGVQCVSEDFSKMKLTNPHLNDLSTSGRNEEKTSEIAVKNQQYEFYEQDDEGDTYLHAAIALRHPEIVLALLRGAPSSNYLDTVNDEGFTPLHLAVVTEQWLIVRWLIVSGAQPSLRNFKGESPLHLASRFGSIPCCRAITEPVTIHEKQFLNLKYQMDTYKRIDLDQWDYEGQTCVHIAALNGHIDVLRLLICNGANINAREGKSGYTALHFAVENRDERMTHFLLNECEKLDTYVKTYAGRSPSQLIYPTDEEMRSELSSRGMSTSPYTSSEEDDDEIYSDTEDDKMNITTPTIYMPQLVDSCV